MTRASLRALLLALASGAMVAALAYPALRLVERALFPTENPAVIVWSVRSALAWRVATALYVGGMGVLGGYALAQRDAARVARWLARGAVAATALVVVQAAIWP
jgi:hypothetical protein